jgi:AAA15 family ATPase/GTPase
MNSITDYLLGVKSMLLQFKFANYRSFADETVFDMTAAPIREHRNSLIEKNGVQALPVAAFYGANASGKSSFFMAFDEMCRIITGHGENKTMEHNVIKSHTKPFIFAPAYADKPTEYEVCFAIGDYEYRYGFEHTGERIICEYLYKRKLSKNKTVEKVIFERADGKIVSKANTELKSEIEYCASMCVEHSLLLTDLGRRKKVDEFGGIYGWFFNSNTLFQFGSLNASFILDGNFIESIFNDNSTISIELREIVLHFITEMDKSVISIESEKKETEEGYILKSVHKYNGKEIKVPFSIESDGTRKLLAVSYSIFMAIMFGDSCFIDELDMQLHPLLLGKIVHIFKNKDINKNGAQLVFSAHNIINLDSSDLRRDEVWFVEKNEHKSSIFSLYDYEDEDGGDIRSDLDYGKHYLLGRFGAIPFQDKDGDE